MLLDHIAERPLQEPALQTLPQTLICPIQVTLAMVQVYFFPSGASSLTDHPWWFALLAVAGLVTSFTSTLMFTALGSFYTRISDPDMGGSYLTLLNTIANMGEPTVLQHSHHLPALINIR